MKLMKKLLCLTLVAFAVVTVASCEQPTEEGPATYTYNSAMSVFPTNWNPHVYQTETDSTILDYTTAGFYTFDYNETKDGYSVVPSMAAANPVDVTADHVGEKWGIEEGETSRAYKIALRQDIKWQDGTAITAHDFVTSAQLLLNPEAANYRADQLYSGDMVIVNAQAYLKQGSYAYDVPMVSANLGADEYVNPSDFVVEDGVYYYVNGDFKADMAVNLNSGGNWGSNGLAAYNGAGYFAVYAEDAEGNFVQDQDEEGNPLWEVDADGNQVLDKEGNPIPVYKIINSPSWDVLEAAADEDGYVVMTPETLTALNNCIGILHGFPYINAADAYAAALEADKKDPSYAYQEWEEMSFYGKLYEEVDFESVGVYASGDYELTIVLDKPLSGFYLLYSLSGSWLVHEPTYTKCESVDANGIYQNTYGTSVDTFMSYGPYKLVEFQKDKIIKFEKNEYYYEYNDEDKYEDPIYQTTHIQIDFVAEEATRLELFNAGKLDAYGLSANDMETYASSDYIYYTKGASTFYMAFNPGEYYTNYDKDHAGECKEMLNVTEFRMALSFALDRASFALVTAPTNSPAIAMFSDLIISDPENGVAYRTTEEAKDVVLAFWGLTDQVGEGKKYATKDEAIDSVTGYDPQGAKALFTAAYNKAVAEGIYQEGEKITICIGTPNATASFYKKGYEFLVNCYTKAVEGTPLEGKLEFSINNTLGNAFSDRLGDNTVDMLFGVGWNGSTLNPYGLITAYTDPNYQYDANTNTKLIDVVIKIDGKNLKLSLYDWTMKVLSGVEVIASVVDEDGNPVKTTNEDGEEVFETYAIAAGTDAPNATRLAIFAACEGELLKLYNLIPLIDDASAALKGMQIKYYTEEYIFGVGRGGIKYMTYHLSDAEWDAFVAQNNGTLNYK